MTTDVMVSRGCRAVTVCLRVDVRVVVLKCVGRVRTVVRVLVSVTAFGETGSSSGLGFTRRREGRTGRGLGRDCPGRRRGQTETPTRAASYGQPPVLQHHFNAHEVMSELLRPLNPLGFDGTAAFTFGRIFRLLLPFLPLLCSGGAVGLTPLLSTVRVLPSSSRYAVFSTLTVVVLVFHSADTHDGKKGGAHPRAGVCQIIRVEKDWYTRTSLAGVTVAVLVA